MLELNPVDDSCMLYGMALIEYHFFEMANWELKWLVLLLAIAFIVIIAF